MFIDSYEIFKCYILYFLAITLLYNYLLHILLSILNLFYDSVNFLHNNIQSTKLFKVRYELAVLVHHFDHYIHISFCIPVSLPTIFNFTAQ